MVALGMFSIDKALIAVRMILLSTVYVPK